MNFPNSRAAVMENLASFARKRPISRFIMQLFKLLNSNAHENIISWNHDGTQFIIKDVTRFSDSILPKIYSHKNFTSFTRQLNMYLFKKNKSGGFFYCYSHSNFQRNREDLLNQITRRKSENKDNKSEQLAVESSVPQDDSKMCQALLFENFQMKEQSKQLMQELQAAQMNIIKLHKENKVLKHRAMNISQFNLTNEHTTGNSFWNTNFRPNEFKYLSGQDHFSENSDKLSIAFDDKDAA